MSQHANLLAAVIALAVQDATHKLRRSEIHNGCFSLERRQAIAWITESPEFELMANLLGLRPELIRKEMSMRTPMELTAA